MQDVLRPEPMRADDLIGATVKAVRIEAGEVILTFEDDSHIHVRPTLAYVKGDDGSDLLALVTHVGRREEVVVRSYEFTEYRLT